MGEVSRWMMEIVGIEGECCCIELYEDSRVRIVLRLECAEIVFSEGDAHS